MGSFQVLFHKDVSRTALCPRAHTEKITQTQKKIWSVVLIITSSPLEEKVWLIQETRLQTVIFYLNFELAKTLDICKALSTGSAKGISFLSATLDGLYARSWTKSRKKQTELQS